ncbi:hypothetical protein L195_g000060 [Trifolium pratense]|uniref:Uncharacterized protein n=1 Tax=Trifolium pratense TaxID=57577 RepID=A0A2K3NKV2_TRIPR|nr:hypothetical protein L195_g000060 [Trifolium pratense]
MKSIMDSISDLSLLEISSDADDSLLSATPTAANLFSCSPLISLRSRPRQIKGREIDSGDLISLTPKDSANKENTNCSKMETPSVGSSQQKKRKKKLGGFNLRKSLAWDRAFFTEQGVLNPMELSMISGTATPNSKSNLEVIDEEEPATTSLALQEIEENLFKHSSGGVSIRDRKIGAVSGLSPKPGASIKQTPPAASSAKRNVLAVNNVGNRYKRSACPRPVPSPSYPCHCLTNAVKTPSKESKMTRIPGPKSNVSANAPTTRSGMSSSGTSKRNQIAPPVTNVQKYAGVKGVPKNPRTVPSIPKVDPADKYSVSRTLTKQAGNRLDNSVSETRPQSKIQQTGSGANKVSDACFPQSRMHQTGNGANKVSEACFPQGVSDTGKKKPQTLFQTTKSSGLRMPSPSIGFFSQAKASSSHGQLQKTSIPCKSSESNIPKLRKAETISVNEARSKIVKRASKNCTKELSLSDVKSEPIMQIDNKKMDGGEVECDSSGFEKVSKQAEVENVLEHVNLKSKDQGELHESDNVASMENVVFPTHEKEFLTKSHTHEQLEKEADHPLDDKLYDISSNGDQSLYQEPESTHCPIMQGTSGNVSSTVHSAIGQDEDDQIKGPTCDFPALKESLILQAEHDTSFKDSRHSGEFKEYNSVKTALLNSSLDNFSKTVSEGSIQGTVCKNTEQVNCGVGEFGRYGGDAQAHLSNESLSVNCNETTQSNLEAISQQQLQGEQLKIPNPSSVGEIASEKVNISDMSTSQPVHVTTLFSEGSPEKFILKINGASENESKIAEINDGQLPVDDQSGFIPRSPIEEEYEQVIDSKAIHDKVQEFELDRLTEDCITVSATACCTNLTNVSPERRHFPDNNVKNLHLTPQLCPTVKTGSDSGVNDMPIDNSSTIPESQIRDDNFSTDTSIHCEVQCDVPGNIEQQASMFTSPEINEISCEDESLVPNHGHHLQQSEFSEVSADSVSSIKDPIGSGAENSSGLLHHTLLAQSVQEFDHAYREIEESHEEDAQAQSFSENPVAYDCRNKHPLVVTNDKFSLADDNNINEDSHLPEFQKPSAVVTVDTLGVNNILQLDSGFLPTIIVSSAETNEQNLVEGAFVGCRFHTNEHDASNHHTYREIEESHVEDEEVQSFNESPVAYDRSSKHCPEVINDQFSLADDNNINEDSRLPELQKPSDAVVLDSQYVNNILHLDSDCVPMDIASSVEIEEQNLVEGAFDGCRFHCNEQNASNHHIQDMAEDKDVNHDIDEKVEFLQIDGAEEGSSDILPVVEVQLNENVISADFDFSITEVSAAWKSEEQCCLSEKLKLLASDYPTFNATIPQGSEVNLVKLNEKVNFAEFDSSTEVSEDPLASVVTWKSEEQCCLREESKLLASDDPTVNATIPQGSEVNSVNSENLSDVAETNICGNDKFPSTDMLCEAKGNIDFPDDNSKIIHLEKTATKSKQEVPIVKPPPNVAPFTEEWLAAIEAAGEEILTMKSGAVQNSPPDKVQHEPSPWSPVKKNQAIGPFDCTKVTKHNIQNSDPS